MILYLIIAILGIISLSKYSIYSKIIPFNNINKIYSQEDKQEKDYLDQENIEDTQDNENFPTLEEYLSQFHCDGCRKQCSLQNPNCETGKKKREEKIKEYYEKYGKKENNDTNKDQTEDKNYLIENQHKKCGNKSNILDVIYIVILFVGATYYFNTYIIKKK